MENLNTRNQIKSKFYSIQFNSIQLYSQNRIFKQDYKILYTKGPKKSNAYNAWAVKSKINKSKYNCNKSLKVQMLKKLVTR